MSTGVETISVVQIQKSFVSSSVGVYFGVRFYVHFRSFHEEYLTVALVLKYLTTFSNCIVMYHSDITGVVRRSKFA